jgi:hypothetical protein
MPIRKFTLDGKRAWALTHVDAVVDDNGRTLKDILGGAPEALDTLKEIDEYIKVNGYDSISAALADKADKTDPVSTFTNDAGYVNELKTINGISLEGTGNIPVEGTVGAVIAGDIVETIND